MGQKSGSLHENLQGSLKNNLEETLKTLQITPNDLKILGDYFSIVHHTKGRIRLRASLKLKKAAEENSVNPKEFLKILEKVPLILSIKFNPLVGSVTIHYDASLLDSRLWEACIAGESLEEIAQVINKSLKEIV